MTTRDPTRSSWLLVGRIAKAHGLRGEVVIVPDNVASPIWREGAELGFYRALPDGVQDVTDKPPERTVKLGKTRRMPDGAVVTTLAGAADRDAADALRGAYLAVDRASLPAPAADEIYHHEVRGWAVVDLADTHLGTVVGIFPGPGGDLVEVLPPASQAIPKPETHYIPFIAAIVQTIDRAGRRLVVDPPEGLIP